MSNVIALNPQRSVRDYTGAQLSLIKRTVAADCNDLEFDLYMEVAKRVGLDPFRRQIYAVVYNKKDEDKRKMSIITGIDGFRAVAARNGDYRPDDREAEFTVDDALKGPSNPQGLVKATVRAYKRHGSEWHPVVGVAYWAEFAPMKDQGDQGFDWIDTGEVWEDSGKPKKRKVPKGNIVQVPDGKWASMPHVMLSKAAEAQALRKGWPEDLSGIYAPEEMDAAPMRDITPTDAIEQHEQESRLRLVKATNTIAVLWSAGQPIEAVPEGQLADKCFAHIKACDSVTGLDWWTATNAVSLREFWARHKADALAVKQAAEARRAELSE